MFQRVLLGLCAMMIYTASQAQFRSAPIFTNGDQIHLHLNADGTYYHLHEVKKGHTLYSIAKVFGYSQDQLLTANNKTSTEVSLGELIKVPIGESRIIKDIRLQPNSKNIYVPVVYTAKPKDNLYRIARIYFKQPIADVQKRNKMSSTGIDNGQNILLGWYQIGAAKVANTATKTTENPTAAVAPNHSNSTTTVTQSANGTVTTTTIITKPSTTTAGESMTTAPQVNSPTVNPPTVADIPTATQGPITNESIDSLLAAPVPDDINLMLLGQAKYREDMELIDTKQVAQWNKNIADNGELYVLHNTAAIDTYMELYNDLVKRSVRAKVIGKIPFGAYTNDVKLIVSPRAAAALGALNERFRVQVKYYK